MHTGTTPPPSSLPSRSSSLLLQSVDVTEPEEKEENGRSSRKSSNGSTSRGHGSGAGGSGAGGSGVSSPLLSVRPLGAQSPLGRSSGTSSGAAGSETGAQSSTAVGGARPKVRAGNAASGSAGSPLVLVDHKRLRPNKGRGLDSQRRLGESGGIPLKEMTSPAFSRLSASNGSTSVEFTRRHHRDGKGKIKTKVRVHFSHQGNNGNYQSDMKVNHAIYVQGVDKYGFDAVLISLGGADYVEVKLKPDTGELGPMTSASGANTLDGIVGVEPDDPHYDTHFVVTRDGEEVPMCLIGMNFDNWNSDGEAKLNALRALVGACFNSSKNTACDMRTLLHIMSTIYVNFQAITWMDQVMAPKIMQSFGLPVVSFTGGVQLTEEQLKVLEIAAIALFSVAISCWSIKDLFAMGMAQEADPQKRKSIANKVTLLEVAGGQLATNGVSTAVMLGAGLGPAEKIIIDNNLPHGVIAAGGMMQGAALKRGKSPVCAFVIYTLMRFLYRFVAMGTQLGTTQRYLGTPYYEQNATATTAPRLGFYMSQNSTDSFIEQHGGSHWLDMLKSMAVTQFGQEIVLILMGALTYWAGGRRPQDGHEEQAQDYAQRRGIPEQGLNWGRLFLSRGIDTVSRGFGDYVGRPLWQGARNVYQRMGSSALGASMLNLDDQTFMDLQSRDHQARRIVQQGPERLGQEQALRWRQELGDDPDLDAFRANFLGDFSERDWQKIREVVCQVLGEQVQGGDRPQDPDEDQMNQM